MPCMLGFESYYDLSYIIISTIRPSWTSTTRRKVSVFHGLMAKQIIVHVVTMLQLGLSTLVVSWFN